VTVVDLLSMSHDELDELFRTSPAGPIPAGEGDGGAAGHLLLLLCLG
jgi:hypothetical protein